MNLYEVLEKKREQMDYDTLKICSILLQETFLHGKVPTNLRVENMLYTKKEKLNSIINDANIELYEYSIGKVTHKGELIWMTILKFKPI